MEEQDAPFKDMFQKEIDALKKDNKDLKQAEQISSNKCRELEEKYEKIEVKYREMDREHAGSSKRTEKMLAEETAKREAYEVQITQMSKQLETMKDSVDT